jgi:hypothetical protein
MVSSGIRTKCECEMKSGMCERHGIEKSEEMVRKCKMDPQAFSVWENHIGPGQLKVNQRTPEADMSLFNQGYPCVARSEIPFATVSCGFCGSGEMQASVPVHHCAAFDGPCSVIPAGDKTRGHLEIRSCSRCDKIAGDVELVAFSSQHPIIAMCVAKAVIDWYKKSVAEKLGPPISNRLVRAVSTVDLTANRLGLDELVGVDKDVPDANFRLEKSIDVMESLRSEISVYGMNPDVTDPRVDREWFDRLFIEITSELIACVGPQYGEHVIPEKGHPMVTPCVVVNGVDEGIAELNPFVQFIMGIAEIPGVVVESDFSCVSIASVSLASIIAACIANKSEKDCVAFSSPAAVIAVCCVVNSGIDEVNFIGTEEMLQFIRTVLYGSPDATERKDGVRCPKVVLRTREEWSL